jgi:TPR repeat protein/lipopolysaccharide biosynthesis regulator YciM
MSATPSITVSLAERRRRASGRRPRLLLCAALCVAVLSAHQRVAGEAPQKTAMAAEDLRILEAWSSRGEEGPLILIAHRLEEVIAEHPDDALAAYWLARLYDEAYLELGKPGEEVIRLLRIAVESNLPMAMSALAAKYYEGAGVPKDMQHAYELTQRAAAMDDGRAVCQLGVIRYFGFMGFEASPRDALPFFEKAADLGYSKGLYYAGCIHYLAPEGDRLRDRAKGLALLKKGAELGNPLAQANLAATCTQEGRTREDYAEALRWAERAARHGDTRAMAIATTVCELLEDLPGVLHWTLEQALAGDAEAQLEAGLLLMNPRAGEPDVLEADRWVRAAAEAGVAKAQRELGFRYAVGIGVPRSRFLAQRWFSKAAKQGDKEAIGVLFQLTQRKQWAVRHVRPFVVDLLAGEGHSAKRLGVGLILEDGCVLAFRDNLRTGQPVHIRTSDGQTSAVSGIVADDPECGLVLLASEVSTPWDRSPLHANWERKRWLQEELFVIGRADGLAADTAYSIHTTRVRMMPPHFGAIDAHYHAPGYAGGGVAISPDGQVVGTAHVYERDGQKLHYVIPLYRPARIERHAPVAVEEWVAAQGDEFSEAEADRLVARAARAFLECDFETGLTTAREAAALDSNNAAAMLWVGACLYGQGNKESATRAFCRCVELQPDVVGGHLCLGGALRRDGHVEEALAELRRALELSPGEPAALYALAEGLKKLGKMEEALAAQQRLAEAEPHSAASKELLLMLLMESGQGHAAIPHAEELLAQWPRCAQLWLWLALGKAKRFSDLPLLTSGSFMRARPDLVSASLFVAHSQAGDFTRAREQLDVMEKLDGERAQQMRDLLRKMSIVPSERIARDGRFVQDEPTAIDKVEPDGEEDLRVPESLPEIADEGSESLGGLTCEDRISLDAWLERGGSSPRAEALDRLQSAVAADPGYFEGTWWLACACLGESAEPRGKRGDITDLLSQRFGGVLKAAREGDVVAQRCLAAVYAHGLGVEADRSEARRWATSAAEAGDLQATELLWTLCAAKAAPDSDRKEGFRWLLEAAGRGSPSAQFAAYEAYLSSEAPGLDLVSGYQWLRRAARSGHVEAQNLLGQAYLAGFARDRSQWLGLKWLRKAAEGSDVTPGAILRATTKVRQNAVVHVRPLLVDVLTGPNAEDTLGHVGVILQDGRVLVASEVILGASSVQLRTVDGEIHGVSGIVGDDVEAGLVVLAAHLDASRYRQPPSLGWRGWDSRGRELLVVQNVRADSGLEESYYSIHTKKLPRPDTPVGIVIDSIASAPACATGGVAVSPETGDIVGLAHMYEVDGRKRHYVIPLARARRLLGTDVRLLTAWQAERREPMQRWTAEVAKAYLCRHLAVTRELLERCPEGAGTEIRAALWEAACLVHGEDMEASASAYRRCMELDGGSVPARVGLGYLLWVTGNPQQGIVVLREALEIDPDSREALFLHGMACKRAGVSAARAGQLETSADLFDEGEKCFRHLLSLEPACDAARLRLAMLFGDTDDWGRAYTVAQELVERSPSGAALNLLGLTACKNGKWAEGLLAIRDGLEQDATRTGIAARGALVKGLIGARDYTAAKHQIDILKHFDSERAEGLEETIEQRKWRPASPEESRTEGDDL